MHRICVYCGSRPGARPEYLAAARELGALIAREDLTLVYGGAEVGLMGAVAQAALDAGGEVIGVIPERLVQREIALTTVTDLRVVASMHERKALMAELADGFIALPGGFGTAEEFFEALAWAQLDLHRKPCGLLNVCGYYDDLLAFFTRTVTERFVPAAHRSLVLAEETPAALLAAMQAYVAPRTDKIAEVLDASEA
jgi:uncharacterized protein (TIGR00730 family)